ncbi:MAG: hypothetical protein PUE65_00785 [Mollicutes bacterium]|nr:hypothetical protein [Mollicutes bacterium]
MIPVLAGLSALALALSPLAIDEASSSKLSLNCNDATQGGYMTLQLEATGLNKISAFSCSLYYPSDCLDFCSQTIDSSISLYNCKETSKGQVAFSFLSADKDGLSFADGTTLLTLSFYVHNDAPIGSIRFTCATGDVYDSNKSSVALNSPYCTSKISQNTYTYVDTVSISLSPSSNENILEGGNVDVIIHSDSYVYLSTFRLILTFDYSYFEFVSLDYSQSFLDGQNNLNTKQQGVVSWANASMNGIMFYGDIATLTLKAKVDQNVTSTVRASLSQVRDSSQNPCNGSDASADLYITESLPRMRMSNLSVTDEELRVDCLIDAKSHMACGDFTVSYPNDTLRLVSTSTSNPNKVIISKDKGDGKLNFSYLDSNDIQVDTTLLSLVFSKKNILANVDGEIGISLRYSDSLPRNSNHEKLHFAYLPSSFSWPFVLRSISFDESWAENGETFSSNDSVYLNPGDAISNVQVNGHSIPNPVIQTGSLNKDGERYVASSPLVLGFEMESGSFYFKEASSVEGAYTRRANQYVRKLGLMTIGKTICNEEGFLPESKDALTSLLKEYDAFPQTLQNQLNVMNLEDGVSVYDRLEVLRRGEHQEEGTTLRGLGTLNSPLFTNYSILILLTSLGVWLLGLFAFYKRRRKSH